MIRFAKLSALDMLYPRGHVQISRDVEKLAPFRARADGVNMDMMPQNLMFGVAWSPLQLMLVLLVVVLLFGKGKVSDLMGDVAKGIKAFKKGMSDDDTPTPSQPAAKPIDHEAARTETHTTTETGTKV
jgi:sec-independent protein translocase protein TatA